MGKYKTYDEDFKKMIVELFQKKTKTSAEILREYGISSSTLYGWISQYGDIKTDTGDIFY